MKFKDRKIGDVFKYKDVTLKVCEGTDYSCENCHFIDMSTCFNNGVPFCLSSDRKDNTPIIYKKIEAPKYKIKTASNVSVTIDDIMINGKNMLDTLLNKSIRHYPNVKKETTMKLSDLNFKVVIPFEEQYAKFIDLLVAKGITTKLNKNDRYLHNNKLVYAVVNNTFRYFVSPGEFKSSTFEHYSYKQAIKLLKKLDNANVCPFEDGEMVLMRDSNDEKWLIGCFQNITKNYSFDFCINNFGHKQAIKYKGNEHQLNTNTNLKHWEKDNGKYVFKY